jgi:hypothetical protein
MKNKGISNSILSYIISRNNDINGYWGIGVLCKYCIDSKRKKCGVILSKEKLGTISSLQISSFVINDGLQTLQRIINNKHIDKIQISFEFKKLINRDFGDTKWYQCNISVLVFGNGNFGFSNKKVECWPHNPSLERRRNIG